MNTNQNNNPALQPLTELDVYKHLLEVAENIIDSLVPDPSIIVKYETLKKAMRQKIKADRQDKQSLEKGICSMYKTMCQQIVNSMGAFEKQMEEKEQDPERPPKNTLEQAMEKFRRKADKEMQNLVQISATVANTRRQQHQIEQIVNQQISEYQHLLNEIEAKFENLTLLQQIHNKMQEIIHQAAQRELSRQQTEKSYQRKIDSLYQQVQLVGDAQEFLHKYEVAKGSAQQIRTIHKQIQSILASD